MFDAISALSKAKDVDFDELDVNQKVIRDLSALITKQNRFGWDQKIVEAALSFKKSLDEWLSVNLATLSKKDFAKLAKRIEKEIETGESPVILSAWFSTSQSLGRPDLLEKLAFKHLDWSGQADRETGRLAVHTALVHPQWAKSTYARGILKRLLNELPTYSEGFMSGPGSVIDRIGRDVFSMAEWREALSNDIGLREIYQNAVFRYLKAVNQYGRDSSLFVTSWLMLPDSASHPDVISEIQKYSPQQILFAYLISPSLRDSDLFWDVVKRALPYQDINIVYDALKDSEADLATSARGEELVRFFYNRILEERYKRRSEMVALAQVISSPPWVSTVVAKEIMSDFMARQFSGDLTNALAAQTNGWQEQTINILSSWANEPDGPKFLVEAIKRSSSTFQNVGHRRTSGGAMIDLVMDEVLKSPRSTIWLKNQNFGDFMNYLLGQEGRYYPLQLLARPELQRQPQYLVWVEATEMRDYEKLAKFLEEHGIEVGSYLYLKYR